jgi:hypothetical protein
MLSILALLLVISVFGRLVGLSMASYFSSAEFAKSSNLAAVNAVSFDYAIPFALGGLLLQTVLGSRYALVFGLSFALLIGLTSKEAALLFPYIIISTCVACLSVPALRSRSAYLRAGVYIAALLMPFALASLILVENLTAADAIIRVSGAILSGILSAILAAGLIPIIEHFGGYVTDLRLIEMATLDHPLLKELSVQCPGTWNHSMVMGMMVEVAAAEIGANPVLARVGAYFHDIGKMKKPLYFIENQSGGENRHDKLSSSMSALILRSHVKDGIELAKKYALPQKVEDMIPQHHGTSRIEYFYDKACREAEESGNDSTSVDPSLYSYPGPKPQSREAGILMLADCIEAASRTLSEPSLDRIQGLVQKMINKVFASGELDECDLTLSDLHAIAKAFTRVLSGIYHQRIAYAEPAEKVSNASQEVDDGKNSKEEIKENKEDLKRLGL